MVEEKELWLYPCALISIWALQIICGVIRSWCFLLAFTRDVIACHHKLNKNQNKEIVVIENHGIMEIQTGLGWEGP